MVSKRTEHACVKQARAAASETPGGTAGPTESARAGQPRAYLRVFGVPSLGCEPGVQWQEPLTGRGGAGFTGRALQNIRTGHRPAEMA